MAARLKNEIVEKIVLLSVDQEYSQNKISKQLNISVGVVNKIIQRHKNGELKFDVKKTEHITQTRVENEHKQIIQTNTRQREITTQNITYDPLNITEVLQYQVSNRDEKEKRLYELLEAELIRIDKDIEKLEAMEGLFAKNQENLEDILSIVMAKNQLIKTKDRLILTMNGIHRGTTSLLHDATTIIKRTREIGITKIESEVEEVVQPSDTKTIVEAFEKDNYKDKMGTFDTQRELVDFLSNKKNRALLASGMKRSFHMYYVIMHLLLTKHCLKESYPVLQMIEHLQQVGDGNTRDLKINIFPGTGKTKTLSYWMAWCLSRNPDVKFLYTSINKEVVKMASAELHNIIKSYFTRDLFKIVISPTRKSMYNFQIKGADARSGYAGVSLKGGITGVDAGNDNAKQVLIKGEEAPLSFNHNNAKDAGNNNLSFFSGGLVVDDPQNANSIRSQAQCKQVHDTWFNTLSSRPRGNYSCVVLAGQRLSKTDLFEAIIEKEGRKGTWLIIPALENGKSTCEWARSTEKLLELSKSESLRELFMAQYQQDPIVPTGELIKEDWFRYHDGNMLEWNMLDMFITGDTAVGKNNAGDYTVFCVWGLTHFGLCLLDMIRGIWDLPEQMKQANYLWKKWRCQYNENGMEVGWTKNGHGDRLSAFYIEDADIGANLIAILKTTSKINLKPLKPDKDKVARVQDASPYIEAGYVYLPANKPNITKLVIDECVKFTYTNQHDHDDIVDNIPYAIRVSLAKNKTIFQHPGLK